MSCYHTGGVSRVSGIIASESRRGNVLIPAQEALERLQEGNRRFVAARTDRSAAEAARDRAATVDSQNPFAVVLGCSDSRVPAELVFDQGLGDLFVIRVAGNVVAPSQIGSVEFAVEMFGTRLVVVLGHTQCGAIQATLDELERPSSNRSPNLHAIVERIRPAVEPLRETELRHDRGSLLARSVRANIHASVGHLRHGSAIIERMIRDQGVRVIGAEYALESGEVAFLPED